MVASRINRARDTEDEKKKFFDEITQRLRKLRMDADKVWLSLPVYSGSLKRIDYPKQICLAHTLSFECFH